MQFSQEPLFLKSLFGGDWNKVGGHKAGNLIKKRLQHRCFPVNIAKFVVTPVLKNSCVWLLLKMIIQKDFLEKPLVTVIFLLYDKYGRLKAKIGVIERWPALACSADGYMHLVEEDGLLNVIGWMVKFMSEWLLP